MAGLVAVIGGRLDCDARERELDRLVSCYRALRHESEHDRLQAGSIGTVAVLAGGGEPRCGIERSADGWSVHLGTVCAPKGILDSTPEELDGQFALLRFDGHGQRVELLSDPFALQAFYVARRDGVLYASSSVLALARHLRARPNRLGVEVFLRSGPHFGAMTSWDGIARLGPASRLRVAHAAAAASCEVYWRPAVDAPARRMGIERSARHCVERSVAALSERYAGGPEAWCDLTGGFDSRLCALLLDRAGVRFTANTVGPAEATDVTLGRRVAAEAGWPWMRGEPRLAAADGWRSVADRALAWGDGQMEVVQLAGVLEGHRERAGTASRLFSGGGGEHWRDYAWQQEGPLGGLTRRVAFRRWVNMRFLAPIDVSAFASDPTARVRADLVRRCRSHVAPYAQELNSVQLDMLYALKSMAHFGAYQSAARGLLAAELPFYAKPVFEAAFSVSPRYRNFHRLMRHAIALLDPRIAALPTTTGGPAQPLRPANALRFIPYADNRVRGAVRKITQRLPGPTIARVPDATIAFEQTLRTRLLEDLEARTGFDPAKMRSGLLYDRSRLQELLRGPGASGSRWPIVGRILTVERALEAADACLE